MYRIYHSFMNVHLIIVEVDFFTVKEPTLHAVCYLHCWAFLKCICTFISMICLIYQISKEGGFCREKIDHRVKRELRMCVFVCVGGRVCANYIL